MKQTVTLNISIPEGYEATGEYRIPSFGETFLKADMTVGVCETNGAGYGPRIILRKKSTRHERTHADVFKLLRDGAVARRNDAPFDITNFWSTMCDIKIWVLCKHYAGTDADVWEDLQWVEE